MATHLTHTDYVGQPEKLVTHLLDDAELNLRRMAEESMKARRFMRLGKAQGMLEAAAKVLQSMAVPVEFDPQVKRLERVRRIFNERLSILCHEPVGF